MSTASAERGPIRQDSEYHAYVRSYSPYDNVSAQQFRHLLVTAGLHDPRVAYWEPAKWVAQLRAIHRAQQIVRDHIPQDRSLAAELVAERRAEAARE